VRRHLTPAARFRWLLVAVACAAPSPALAADDDEPLRLMLVGPRADEEARDEALRLLHRMDPAGPSPADVLAAADALPVTADPGLQVYGDILVTRCAGLPTYPDGVLEALERGMGEVAAIEYEAAIASFEQAEAQLPCLSGYLPEGRLSDLYFFHGLASFYVEGEARARRLFARALSAQPSRPWDDRFPPPPQQVFLDAGKDVLHVPPRPIRAADPAGVVAELRIDAEVWSGFPDVPRTLVPGTHLLQWRGIDGRLQSQQLELVPGGQLVLLTGAGYLAAVLDGGRDPALAEVVAPALGQVAVDHGAGQLVIVRNGDQPQISLYDPADGSFEPTRKERFLSSFEEQRQRWGPRGALSLGMGFATAIAPRDEWDFQYLALTAQAEFRVIAGIYLDVALNIGLRRGEVNRDSIVALPSSRIGVRYSLQLSPVRPFLGVAGQTVMYGRDDVVLGGGALFGVALELPRARALRLAVEGFVGRIRNWTLQATVQVGVYY
jgi:hypothetical protein